MKSVSRLRASPQQPTRTTRISWLQRTASPTLFLILNIISIWWLWGKIWSYTGYFFLVEKASTSFTLVTAVLLQCKYVICKVSSCCPVNVVKWQMRMWWSRVRVCKLTPTRTHHPFPALQALVINGVTFSIKSLAVGDPVGRGRKTKRDWGGSQSCSDFNGSSLPSVVMSLQRTDKA